MRNLRDTPLGRALSLDLGRRLDVRKMSRRECLRGARSFSVTAGIALGIAFMLGPFVEAIFQYGEPASPWTLVLGVMLATAAVSAVVTFAVCVPPVIILLLSAPFRPREPAGKPLEPAGEAVPPALPPAAPVLVRRPTAKGLAQAAIAFVVGIPVLIFTCQVSGVVDFSNTKEKAYTSTMKADLRNLWTAEESYFSDNVTYTKTLPASVFTLSAGVTVTIGAADSTGWNATATHVGLPGTTCAIFSGSGPAVAPATEPRMPKCTP